MGRSRYDVDRATKIAEILDEAETRFSAEGYDGVSIASIARAVGLAPNAVSWYFPSKDALLVAVLERALDRGLEELAGIAADLPSSDTTVADQIIWATDRLHELRHLGIALHQRMTVSDAAAAFHDRLHHELGRLLSMAIRDLVEPAELDTVVALIITTAEGQLLHPYPSEERNKLIRSVLARYGIIASVK